jgi:hypothetical protein
MEKSAAAQEDPSRVNFIVTGDTLVCRVPAYEDTNLGCLDNIGKHLRWACTILGLKNPTVKLLKDPVLGKAVTLPNKVERMMDSTLAALSLPSVEVGERADFKTGLKGNLPELLAAIKLVRKYGGSLQKGVAPKGHKVNVVTLDDLKRSVNGRAGLNEHGIDNFTPLFVKFVFNELTKPNWSSFPGKWIHSLKSTNNVKNNIGIIYKLGYETKAPNMQKVSLVINTRVIPKSKSKTKEKASKGKETLKKKDVELQVLDPKKDSDAISHQEFRLAVFLALPLIDPKDKASPTGQILRDPGTVKSKTITSFYSKNRDVVDALNLAYATRVAIGRKGSKATVLGYKSARGHAIRLTANRPWQDANGVEYHLLSELPDHTRQFLLSHFNRKLVEEDPPASTKQAKDEKHDSSEEESDEE